MNNDMTNVLKQSIYDELSMAPSLIEDTEMTPELCIFAVKLNGLVLKKIPKKLHTEELCLAAVTENGMALKHVSKKVISVQICMTAVQNNGDSIKYVSNNMLTKVMCDEAIIENGVSIEYVPEKRITKNRALRAIKQDGLSLKYIPDKIKSREMFEYAASNNGLSLEFVPGRRKTKKICIDAVMNNPLSLEFVPNRFISNEMLTETYNKTWKVFCFFPEEEYTYSNCLDFLKRIIKLREDQEEFDYSDKSKLNRIVANFPDEVNLNIEIIRLERVLNVREFTVKWYDDETKLFEIEEKLHYNKTKEVNEFRDFDDFYNCLDGNLRNAELYNFEFSNVKLDNYNIEGAFISSSILVKHRKYNSSYYEENIESSKDYLDLVPSIENEKIKLSQNIQVIGLSDVDLSGYTRNFYYISDIHLDHKLKERFPQHATKLEIKRYVEEVVSDLFDSKADEDYYDYLLIAGDISFNFEISKIFYTELKKRRMFENIIVVLGNHELWNYNSIECGLDEIIDKYRLLFKELKIIFLQNDLLLIDEFGTKFISENELELLDVETLKHICLKSSTSILGGLGFSGLNIEFNVENGIYRDAITSLEDDKKQTERFGNIYSKVKEALFDSEVIVMTHTPKSNWSKCSYNSNWVYVNGHTHTNMFVNDGDKTLYADNQIGYYNETVELRYFQLTRAYDIFKYYKDGKYTISRMQYKNFNRGMGIEMNFKRVFDKIHMLKREGIYCFFVENKGSI